MQQTPYPMGPLSLYQLGYWKVSLHFHQIHGMPGSDSDAYDLGIVGVAQRGIYPTFGHIDCKHGRWYKDIWGERIPENEVPIPRDNRCPRKGRRASDVLR